jgi:hypothetical protein
MHQPNNLPVEAPRCQRCLSQMKPTFDLKNQSRNCFNCDYHDPNRIDIKSDVRWRCADCDYDICFKCKPGTSNLTAPGYYLADAQRTSSRSFELVLEGKESCEKNNNTFSRDKAVEIVSNFATKVHSFYDEHYGIEGQRGSILVYLSPNGEEKILRDTIYTLMFSTNDHVSLDDTFFIPYYNGIEQYYKLPLTKDEKLLERKHCEDWLMLDTKNAYTSCVLGTSYNLHDRKYDIQELCM